jgi:hypothetical protein
MSQQAADHHKRLLEQEIAKLSGSYRLDVISSTANIGQGAISRHTPRTPPAASTSKYHPYLRVSSRGASRGVSKGRGRGLGAAAQSYSLDLRNPRKTQPSSVSDPLPISSVTHEKELGELSPSPPTEEATAAKWVRNGGGGVNMSLATAHKRWMINSTGAFVLNLAVNN